MTPTLKSDIVIVGGGIVGLATARQWQKDHPGQNVIVLEAEPKIASHQSGHNSGVIHSGIYYRPGSEKAVCCRHGKTMLEMFCRAAEIPFERCGKVVVASSAAELDSLDRICERAELNGVDFRRINTDELRRLEPSVAGIAAIHVPETGIVDYAAVCRAFEEEITQRSGRVITGQRVVEIELEDQEIRLTCDSNDGPHPKQVFRAKSAICCGGLQSDRLYQEAARASGGTIDPSMRIVPFRGEYYKLKSSRRDLCRNLIYPVPDPSFPFLGVHFTRMIDGEVECGPNAVWAFSREGYRFRDIEISDMIDSVSFSGFRRLVAKHWRMGLGEMHRSLSRAAFVNGLQKLIPSVRSEDLVPARAGVRAQAVSSDGKLVDDFVFSQTPKLTHVLNAPSPAATASMAIAGKNMSATCISGTTMISSSGTGFESVDQRNGLGLRWTGPR